MIRELVAGLALLAGCSTNAVPATSDNAVAVLMKDGRPSCSAFAIGPNELLTAAHCVRDEDTARVASREMWDRSSSGSVEAEVVSRDVDRDVAVLRVPTKFRSHFELRRPIEGETVFAIAAIFDWSKSAGTVLPGEGFFRDSTVTIRHGWSGSPVVGLDGRAVGIIHSCRGVTVDNKHVCDPDNAAISVLP